jgi:hypothetical protein
VKKASPVSVCFSVSCFYFNVSSNDSLRRDIVFYSRPFANMPVVTVNSDRVNIFPYIGIIPLLVGLGYMSCILLVGGMIVIILVNDGFFDPNAVKILYLSDGMSKHLALIILGFGSCYSILFAITMIVAWYLENISMFGLGVLNVIAFHGVLSYVELNGPEHPCFVAILLGTHSVIHHIAANSRDGFDKYRYITNTSSFILVLYAISWFFADIIFNIPELKVTTVALELFIWCTGCLEYACMTSFMHEREQTRYDRLSSLPHHPEETLAGVGLKRIAKKPWERDFEATNLVKPTDPPDTDKKSLDSSKLLKDFFQNMLPPKQNDFTSFYHQKLKEQNPQIFLFPTEVKRQMPTGY